MNTTQTIKSFKLVEELERTVLQSLTTTFGVDFLLFQDKEGGDVDTIHNVRKGIYATDAERQKYDQREKYDSSVYHKDSNYKKHGRADKQKQQTGELYDVYRGKIMPRDENRHLDHTIPASKIHNDAGRILAEKDGVLLANNDYNLNSTSGYINLIKSNHDMCTFVNEVAPKKSLKLEQSIEKNTKKFIGMPNNTLEERHNRRNIENDINRDKEKLLLLQEVERKKNEMIEADLKARKKYDNELNEYYKSKKFITATGFAAASAGIRMGLRETLGIILGEVWVEIRKKLPAILEDFREKFSLSHFLERICEVLKAAWHKVKKRFNELLSIFGESSIAGICSNVITTLLNIIVTTQKMIVKLMREMWLSIVKAVKLLFFNPNNLAMGDLIREVTRLLGAGLATVIGVLVNQNLDTLLIFPLGSELSAFIGAFFTGLLTLGLTWGLDHSEMMQDVWRMLNQFKSKYKKVHEHYEKINIELDRYLNELAKVRLNMNPDELATFADELAFSNNEYVRSHILDAELRRRNIALPFESNSEESIKDWLLKL